MQTVIVIFIVGVSAAYLIRIFIRSLRANKKGHCSSCGKE